MELRDHERYQSGEICIAAGWYVFDGFLDDGPNPYPSLNELEISLGFGDLFPRGGDPRRDCYWRPIEHAAPQERAQALTALDE